MESNKNSVLLTVIAVATLLVAVVGATFAYFTAQGGTGTSANVTVSTGTAGSSTFSTFSAISIYADATTFASGAGDKTGSSSGTVSWTAPGAAGNLTPSEADRSFCYTATLDVTSNTFGYSTANSSNVAELEFSAKKGTTVLIDKKDITTGTTDVQIPTTAGGTSYKHKIIANAGATVSDSWTLTVTLKNKDFSQNENAGKQFSGVVKFEKTTC